MYSIISESGLPFSVIYVPNIFLNEGYNMISLEVQAEFAGG